MSSARNHVSTTLFVALLAVGCSESAPNDAQVASLDLRGTRIDGSEDRGGSAKSEEKAPELAVAIEEIAPPDGEPPALEPAPELAVPIEEIAPPDEEPPALEPAPSSTDEAQPSEADESDESATASASGSRPEPEEEPERDEHAELGRLLEDGVRALNFKDLSLEGMDYELLVDSLLFPEEYEEDGLELPANIAALSGQVVSVQGYMIPGKIARGGNVRDFMLVRDLLACCFGGIPKPDEWIDVVMADDAEAEYIRYMPLVVTGTLSVGEDMDVDAFNPAVFRLVGTAVRRRE